nr:HAD hydrolase-like protein [Dechloromonas sp.]
MTYRLAIFDFDGTLADSFPFFVQVYNEVAGQHRFKEIDPALLPSFKGHTAREMMRHVGMPAWKLPLVAGHFIGLMREHVAEIELFAGVDTLLSDLAEQGVTLAIVSSNSLDNVRTVLGPANAGLIRHLECGMSIFGKARRLSGVLDRLGVARHEAIYIGDQTTDLEAARKARIDFGAVSWGFGTIESLRRLGPDHEFASVSDILRIGAYER